MRLFQSGITIYLVICAIGLSAILIAAEYTSPQRHELELQRRAWCAAGHKIMVSCDRGLWFMRNNWTEDACQTCKYGQEGIYVTDCPCGLNSNYGGTYDTWRWLE